MKVIAVSDSHGNYANLIKLLKANAHARYIIHLGDGEEDISDLEMYEPELFAKLIFVGGNCDRGPHARVRTVTLGGARIFLAHGDRFDVKTDKTVIAAAAQKAGCTAAFFGHTHLSFCGTVNGIFLLCPGSCDCQSDMSPPSYAIAEIENGSISARICAV